MCDGMKIDKRLVAIGVMLIVLSMTMASQYATTKVTYSFAIAHPSDADIRYIGSDNSSGDAQRVLRVTNNASGTQFATIELGDWMPNSQKNYTAAFGIVNEEQFAVNITHMNITGINISFFDVWLHGDRDTDVSLDAGGSAPVRVINDGTALFTSTDVVWVLGAGDSDPFEMNTSGGDDIETPWDETANVRYSEANWDAVNGTQDFVWVQISLNIDQYATVQSATGTLFVHFTAYK